MSASESNGESRTVESLAEREARLRAIPETSVEGIITIHDRGMIESMNPGAARMFGYSESEAMAQEEVRARLDDLIKTMDSPNLKFETRVLVGKPFLEMIRQVLIERHELVIKTAERSGGLGSRIFGSTGQHLSPVTLTD